MGDGLEVCGVGEGFVGGYGYEGDGLVGVLSQVGLGKGLDEGVGDLEAEGKEIAAFVPEAWRWVYGGGGDRDEVFGHEEEARFFGELSDDSRFQVFVGLHHASGMLVKRLWTNGALLPHHKERFPSRPYKVEAHRSKSPTMQNKPRKRTMRRMQRYLLNRE